MAKWTWRIARVYNLVDYYRPCTIHLIRLHHFYRIRLVITTLRLGWKRYNVGIGLIIYWISLKVVLVIVIRLDLLHLHLLLNISHFQLISIIILIDFSHKFTLDLLKPGVFKTKKKRNFFITLMTIFILLSRTLNLQPAENILMGEVISCCNADLFSDLTKKYGQKFTKLMIAEKTKEFILVRFQELINKFKEIFLQFQNKVTGIVSTKKEQLHGIYSKIKNEVNGKIPGGIEIFQRLKGQSIDEFSGYNRLQSKVDDIKIETLGKIDSEKDILLGSVDTAKSKMVTKIDQQRPKIQYYDSLPPQIQQVLRQQAQKLLAKEIAENKDQIATQIAKQFNPENTLTMLTKFSPDQQLTGIVGQAGQVFSAALSQIAPGAGSGGIGGLIQGGLNLFGV